MSNLIEISSRAERELKRLDRATKNRIVKAVFGLIDNARPPGCRKVKTSEGLWRIRVGDLRVGYEISGNPSRSLPSGIGANFTIDDDYISANGTFS